MEVEAQSPSKVLRKLHANILPLFCLIAGFCYIDRTNLAYASLSLTRDLKFTPEVYGLGSGLFFLGYAVFMIPSNIVLLRVGAPLWIGIIVSIWGCIATSFTWMGNKYQFYTLRMLLGVAEAGAFPGMWYYMYLFYPPDHIVFPLAVMEAAVAGANVMSAPLAAGFLMLDGKGSMKGWQWLFLLEGIPTICLGLLVSTFMPRTLSHATFLTGQDKRWLSQQLDASKKLQHESEAFTNRQVFFDAMLHWKVWYIGGVAFLKNMAFNGILFWCPILVGALMEGMAGVVVHPTNFSPASVSEVASAARNKSAAAALLTSIPFILAALFALWLGTRNTRLPDRHNYLAIPYFISGMLLSSFPRIAAASAVSGFAVLSIVIASLQGSNTVLNSYVPAFVPGPGMSVSLATYNSIGNLGSVLGPWLVGEVVQRTGRYDDAVRLLGAVMCFAAIMAWYTHSWARQISGREGSAGNDDITRMLEDEDDF